MKTGTLFTAALLLATVASAQTRNDVIWARDIGAATITLDGRMNEAVWAQAEKITFRWNQNAGLPGSGQKVESGTLINPTDPTNATLSILRKGNLIYMALNAADKSIGGGRALHAGNWNFDGFIMNMYRRGTPSATDPNFFGGGNTEFIYGWWHPTDTTATGGQKVNAAPRAFGNFACDWMEDPVAPGRCTLRADTTKWNYRTTWVGTTNSDTHGDDGGYVMEMMIDASKLQAGTAAGYNFGASGGDRVPFNFAVQDADYLWPADPAKQFVSRVWYQNQWANNFIHGVGFIAGAPGVTTTSGAVPTTPFAVRIPNGSNIAPSSFILDGLLNDRVWQGLPTAVTLKYKDTAVLSQLPGGGLDFARYFAPNISGTATAPPVVDPSTARVKWFFRGDFLNIAVDVDDQAVSGAFASEDRRDGVRLSFHTREVDANSQSLKRVNFEFVVDSTGNVRFGGDAAGIRATNPDAIIAISRLKPGSTAGNPNDVDAGYTMEISINLVQALKYPTGRGDGLIWPSILLYDADILQDAASSTSTRTWWYRERADGPGAAALMDVSLTTATETPGMVDGLMTVLGVTPNPSVEASTLRYTLGQAARVTVAVYDLLGRQVLATPVTAQVPGVQEVALGDGLTPGVYLYRLTVDGPTGRQEASGRFVRVR